MSKLDQKDDIMSADKTESYVTMIIDGQMFGLPIARVHDVFMLDALTRVPMAAEEIAGILNLRGRIVTAIDMRKRLSLAPFEDYKNCMAIGIESKGESYGLMIDKVGEVMDLPVDGIEANPVNLDKKWVEISAGVYRLEGALMIVLDVDRVLGSLGEKLAA
jgi:purine-binding chemotaxis protein CheW